MEVAMILEESYPFTCPSCGKIQNVLVKNTDTSISIYHACIGCNELLHLTPNENSYMDAELWAKHLNNVRQRNKDILFFDELI
jgi:hypothetical protein